jgi:transcriptional regulator with GAF, ATPase, and Fis domain
MHECDEANYIRAASLNILSNLGQSDECYVNNVKFDNNIPNEKYDYSERFKDLPQILFFLKNNKNNILESNLYDIDSQKNKFSSISKLSGDDLLDNCRLAFEALPSWSNFYQFLSHVAHIACSELGAERALLAQSLKDGKLEIKATSNISSKELETGVLTSHLASICKKIQRDPIFLEKNGVVSLTIPLIIGGSDFWILYIESVYAVSALKNLNEQYYREISLIFSQELRSAFRYADTNSVDQFALNFTPSFFRTDNSESIVYESQIMRKLISRARQVAITEAPILILGETGVGKELLAQYIHNCSGRPGNFIPVHPASNAENIFESEFFGHEKGAFTSAHRKKIGLVELAHNGTLFIDEVGDIPMAFQTKLLRVFQDRRFWRVGGDSPIDSNFRLVGATNKDLWKEVQAGRFRKDLYYRMAVIPLTIPPLRERKEDIPVLTKLFLSKFSNLYNKNIFYPDKILIDKFYEYDWPGNVREMKSVVERSVILYKDSIVDLEMLFLNNECNNYSDTIESNENIKSFQNNDMISDFPTLDILEARYIKYVLNKTNGKISGKHGALDILGMKRSTFYSKIKNNTALNGIK